MSLYHDSQLDMTIDNGNHLVLSGNKAVGRYLRDIGAEGRVVGPDRPEFTFLDLEHGVRWTLRLDVGPCLAGSSMPADGCRARAFATIWVCSP